MDNRELAERLVKRLNLAGKKITTIESCTGGLIAGAITSVAGSSAIFDYGFVTYSNSAKTALVGVPEAMLQEHGAVSEPVARAMAEGGLQRSGADIALSVTGIAGPGGAVPGKPVGTVWFGLAMRSPDGVTDVQAQLRSFGDIGRDAVRETSVMTALAWALEALPDQAAS